MMLIEAKRIIITEFNEDMVESVLINSLDEDNRRFVPDEVFETIDEAITKSFSQVWFYTGVSGAGGLPWYGAVDSSI